jgi:hypothetical protein
MKTTSVLRLEVLSKSDCLTKRYITGLFDGHLLAVSLPGVLPEAQCQQAARQVRSMVTSSAYAGNLSSGVGNPTWSVKSEQGDTPEAWHSYFRSVAEADTLRRRIFEPIIGIDPLDLLLGLLRSAWGGPVVRAEHPRYGRLLNGCLVRGGVAQAHHDEAGKHAGLESIGHIGLVLVLDAMPGAHQRVWPVALEPGDLESYPMPEPKDCQHIVVPTPVGSVSAINATRRHDVKDDERRLTVAIHVSLHPSGRLDVYA